MKKLVFATTALVLMSSTAALAAGKSYPLVGQVAEITSSKITVIGGNKKKWEIARDANSKVPADIKVGSIVVVNANLTAEEVVDKTPKAVATPAKTDAKAPTEPKAKP